MPETFDSVTITERLDVGAVVVLPDRIHHNGVDIVGGAVPTIEKLSDSAGQVDANRKVNELIDLMQRAGMLADD